MQTPEHAPVKQQAAGKMRLTCPHCKQAARVRHSRELSDVYRDGIVECQNIAQCGWRGRLGVEYLATLTPSAMPNPNVDLPLSPYVLPTSNQALPAPLRAATLSPQQLYNKKQTELFPTDKY